MCVYDQNYALVIVTQPKKEEFPNKFARISQCEYLIQIYKTNFILKLSSFVEQEFYITACAGRSSAYTSPLIRSLFMPDLSQIEKKEKRDAAKARRSTTLKF